MQSGYQGQIAKLHNNMNEFHSFKNFMAGSSDDFTPFINLGYGSTLLPSVNQVIIQFRFINYNTNLVHLLFVEYKFETRVNYQTCT